MDVDTQEVRSEAFSLTTVFPAAYPTLDPLQNVPRLGIEINEHFNKADVVISDGEDHTILNLISICHEAAKLHENIARAYRTMCNKSEGSKILMLLSVFYKLRQYLDRFIKLGNVSQRKGIWSNSIAFIRGDGNVNTHPIDTLMDARDEIDALVHTLVGPDIEDKIENCKNLFPTTDTKFYEARTPKFEMISCMSIIEAIILKVGDLFNLKDSKNIPVSGEIQNMVKFKSLLNSYTYIVASGRDIDVQPQARYEMKMETEEEELGYDQRSSKRMYQI